MRRWYFGDGNFGQATDDLFQGYTVRWVFVLLFTHGRDELHVTGQEVNGCGVSLRWYKGRQRQLRHCWVAACCKYD